MSFNKSIKTRRNNQGERTIWFLETAKYCLGILSCKWVLSWYVRWSLILDTPGTCVRRGTLGKYQGIFERLPRLATERRRGLISNMNNSRILLCLKLTIKFSCFIWARSTSNVPCTPCLYVQIFSPSDLDSEEGINRVLQTLDSLENVAAGKFLFIFCCKMSWGFLFKLNDDIDWLSCA